MAGKSVSITSSALVIVLCGGLAFSPPASATEVQPQTIAAFNRYVELTEASMRSGPLSNGAFLWVDRMSMDRRAATLAQLQAGKVVIEQLKTTDNGKTIEVPGGLIHHWIGTVFIPGATLPRTLSLLQDYDHHQDYYKPDVIRSKILRHDGNNYEVLLRFHKQKIISAVLDTDHTISYQDVGSTRALSQSNTTRIQQVDNAGRANETLRPVGNDDGFLWRMNTYWRFEERDGGTYVESQSISLTRDIPTGLGWLIGPFVSSIPRESLTFTLGTTRRAVLERNSSWIGR